MFSEQFTRNRPIQRTSPTIDQRFRCSSGRGGTDQARNTFVTPRRGHRRHYPSKPGSKFMRNLSPRTDYSVISGRRRLLPQRYLPSNVRRDSCVAYALMCWDVVVWLSCVHSMATPPVTRGEEVEESRVSTSHPTESVAQHCSKASTISTASSGSVHRIHSTLCHPQRHTFSSRAFYAYDTNNGQRVCLFDALFKSRFTDCRLQIAPQRSLISAPKETHRC